MTDQNPHSADDSARIRASLTETLWTDSDGEAMPIETVVDQVADVSRKLKDELECGDFASARESLDRLNGLYPELNVPIDLATDPAVHNPLVDAYEAAVELRIEAQSRIGLGADEQAKGRADA